MGSYFSKKLILLVNDDIKRRNDFKREFFYSNNKAKVNQTLAVF